MTVPSLAAGTQVMKHIRSCAWCCCLGHATAAAAASGVAAATITLLQMIDYWQDQALTFDVKWAAII